MLARFPEGYRHLAYLQAKNGFTIKLDLPQLKGPVVEALYAHGRAWLEGARSGGGPTLIEHVTYRGAAHSTSDDPARYRPKNDYEKWPLGDPVERLKNHLIRLGEWSEERHVALTEELEQTVSDNWKQATRYGTLNEGPRLDRDLMFEDVFKEMPEHLRRQRDQLRAEQG